MFFVLSDSSQVGICFFFFRIKVLRVEFIHGGSVRWTILGFIGMIESRPVLMIVCDIDTFSFTSGHSSDHRINIDFI